MPTRSLRYVIPIAIFAALVLLLWSGLELNKKRPPNEIPSPLIGKPAPEFLLPMLEQPEQAWSPSQLRGQVWLLNVWASWCAPCLVEHPVLVQMARDQSLPIVGFNYKDERGAATAWLGRHGNPYRQVVADRSGAAAFDYGVYGVPESFLIDKAGTIRFKHVGPLTPEVVNGKLLPLVRELSR
jgi:cytochrome c biogenesis protein CcmG/thiol:disulfide interchange protein DsbE